MAVAVEVASAVAASVVAASAVEAASAVAAELPAREPRLVAGALLCCAGLDRCGNVPCGGALSYLCALYDWLKEYTIEKKIM